MSIDDKLRSGRPSTARTHENVEKIREIIKEDRRRTIEEIVELYPFVFLRNMIMGFGLPILIQDQSLTMGTVVKFLYGVPTNSSVYLDSVFNRERRSVSKTSRWDIYSMLEAACSRLGLDGRACVLRAICEAADTTLQHNGLAGEVLHVLLTPSTTTEARRTYMDSEYYAAERLGTEISGNCHLLYSECEVGLLDFISKVEY
ncbi:hypothetical protein B7P43_G06736 [Cryptotermes secundus]|uniref:Uncharacterized protein n=1 Tax=Cryptotermes secundus TaxID=105785 RepID=A0A2J7QZ69_9NEOP|nr:hypothetical protein B7P43_G06736 [Cryptotermes secundus]